MYPAGERKRRMESEQTLKRPNKTPPAKDPTAVPMVAEAKPISSAQVARLTKTKESMDKIMLKLNTAMASAEAPDAVEHIPKSWVSKGREYTMELQSLYDKIAVAIREQKFPKGALPECFEQVKESCSKADTLSTNISNELTGE